MPEDSNIERAVPAQGERFVAVRDELLALGADTSNQDTAAEKDWNKSATVHILSAWSKHEVLYRQLLAEKTLVDQTGNRYWPWMSGDALPNDSAGLLTEMALKNTVPNISRHQLVNALVTLARRGVPIDKSLFLNQLADEKFTNRDARRSSATMLSKLPSDDVSDADLLAALRWESQRAKRDEFIYSVMLDALATRTSALKLDEREMIAREILSMDQVRTDLGPVNWAFAMGGIRAKEATPLVEEVLKEFDDLVLQRRAINTLSRIPDPSAVAIVMDYAQRDDVDPYVRSAAVRALGNVPHSADIDSAIQEIAGDDFRPAEERLEAIRSLAKLRQAAQTTEER
jgi:hypothetical protein